MAKTIHPIGTLKEFGGRTYIKTTLGWKYHGSGKGAKAQAHAEEAKGIARIARIPTTPIVPTNPQEESNKSNLEKFQTNPNILIAKEGYLQKIREWAPSKWDVIEKVIKAYRAPGAMKTLGRNEYWEHEKFYHRNISLYQKGKDAFIELQVQNGEKYFDQILQKAAAKCDELGLNLNSSNVSIERSQYDFEITVKDSSEGKNLHMWTILAWGEVNAPHYRFLIKERKK